MKFIRFFAIFFLALLAACSPGETEAQCKKGICVSIKVETGVQALEPVLFTIVVKTEKDVVGLGVSVSGGSIITIGDTEKIPAEAQLVFQDKRSRTWKITTKSGVEYRISGYAMFPKPTVSYGIFSYSLYAYATHPDSTVVRTSINIYLDSSGKQVEDGNAKILLQTGFPLPTLRPDVTVVLETPMPTLARPTSTSLPSPTPTQPAYPAPGKPISTEGANQKLPLPSPTLAAYPSP